MSSYLQKKIEGIENVVIVYPFTYINPYYALPPIAAEYLQAAIVETGRKAMLLDMRFEADIREHLERADLVCLYGHFENCSMFGKWDVHVIPEVLNQIPSCTPVIAGGTGFTNPVQRFVDYPQIDIIIRGSPEFPIMDLLNKGTPEGVNNLVYRKENEIIPSPRVVHNISETIYPRRALRNRRYNYHSMGIKTDLIRAAIGCNYKCKFCYQYGKDFDGNPIPWQGRSARSLFNELKEIEAPVVGWVDDDMTSNMNTLEQVADLLLQHNVHKLYAGTGRLDPVLKCGIETLRKLERAGLIALSFGVESLKPETLKLYGKRLSIDKIQRAMSLMQKTNILLICNFIFGSPGETEKDMMDMLWFGRKWNADNIVTNRLGVPKDTPLYDLIYDHETGKPKPGLEMITGEELAKIKYRVKFAQRTPLRILLTILKLYRHKGMFIDPFYIFCCVIETVIKHTWFEKAKVLPCLLKIAKIILAFPLVRQLLRLSAIIFRPPLMAFNRLLEAFDKLCGISTTVLPMIFLYFENTVYKKQKIHSQLNR